MRILALNCGSSSLKFGVYQNAQVVAEGEAEEIGKRFRDHKAALDWAWEQIGGNIAAVGHRFVHGGRKLREHTLIDKAVQQALEAAAEYAPLHMPSALALLAAAKGKLPDVPQAACLDTAFHNTLPEVSRTFALPEPVRTLGVERYGFHGLSLESIVEMLDPVPARLIVAHLGNGASVTAVRAGKSIDTSMGLTPGGGFMMGTRSGDLDPGVLTYLLRHGYDDVDKLEGICERESGLRGVSGGVSDVRTLLERREEDARADLALQMFCYQVRKTIAAMAAALGGVDTLVFTGGIGEHAEQVRNEIADGLVFLGKMDIRVLPSQEDLQIAKITERLAGANPRG